MISYFFVPFVFTDTYSLAVHFGWILCLVNVQSVAIKAQIILRDYDDFLHVLLFLLEIEEFFVSHFLSLSLLRRLTAHILRDGTFI
jgi:hypothetical protein